ncbi:MAG: hypothetical protein M3R43_06105 [Acidobacteriota bacterium]|nr:hypothetical protein [Acidobacteriota bacterium]
MTRRGFVTPLPEPVSRAHLPQLDSAEQPLSVDDDLHVLGQFKTDELGIAAAKEEPVVVERDLEVLDRLA